MPLDQRVVMSVRRDQPDPVPSSVEGPDQSPVTTADSTSTLPPAGKKRRVSKEKTLPEIKRSLSTPHMRSLALGESGALSPTSDKRRNKLGYHRTSVACGHCRRRKIRCLLAADDAQGRCSNCIRLKKECNFYPVEQQLSPDPRAPAPLKMEVPNGAPSTSSSSSPRTSATPMKDHLDEGSQFQALPGHAGSVYAINPDADARFGVHSNSEGQYPSASRSATKSEQIIASGHGHIFPYGHGVEGQSWDPTEFARHPASPDDGGTDGPSSAFWRLNNSPPSIQAGSRATGLRDHKMDANAHYAYAYPTARSLSYGNIEGLPNGQALQQLQSQHGYPTPLDTHMSPLASQADSDMAMSAPGAAQSVPHAGYQQPWSPYAAQNQAFINPWAGGRLGQVDEELNQGAPYTTGLQHF